MFSKPFEFQQVLECIDLHEQTLWNAWYNDYFPLVKSSSYFLDKKLWKRLTGLTLYSGSVSKWPRLPSQEFHQNLENILKCFKAKFFEAFFVFTTPSLLRGRWLTALKQFLQHREDGRPNSGTAERIGYIRVATGTKAIWVDIFRIMFKYFLLFVVNCCLESERFRRDF